MARDSREGIHERQSAWRIRLYFLRQTPSDTFSDEAGYCDSRWASWEKRIQRGHAAEEKLIEQIYNRHKKQSSSNPYYDPDEWAGEDYMETCRLTTTMYAALIVSIWSEMEDFLKGVIVLCHQAFGKRKKAIQKTQKFCEDSLAGKLTKASHKATLNSCIKAMRELQARIPHTIDEIKKAIEREVHVKLEKCQQYSVVDAVRILNNSFKHSRGRYRPDNGKIDATLLKRWHILDEQDKIDYSKLPVKEFVVACNCFCVDLLDRVETYLRSKVGGGE